MRRTPEEKLFGGLMQGHHYLAYTQPIGEPLKYLVWAQGQPIAGLAWSSAPQHRGPLQRILDLSSQFSALNPVREIWTATVQNASTPPPARYFAQKRRFKPRNTRKMNPSVHPVNAPALLLACHFGYFVVLTAVFPVHWSFLVETHPPHPFALIPP